MTRREGLRFVVRRRLALQPGALVIGANRKVRSFHCYVAVPILLEQLGVSMNLQAMKLIGAGDPVIANWSVQKSLDDMDKGGIATAVLSGNPPQVRPVGRDVAARIARESNEYVNN